MFSNPAKADASDDGRNTIEAWFGQPKRPIDPQVSDGTQMDSETLAGAYNGRNTSLGEYTRFTFENGEGWWTVLAPPERADMNSYYTLWTNVHTAMEPAPEDTAPRYVSYQFEQGTYKLTRYALGTYDHHDFFKTADGRKAMDLKVSPSSLPKRGRTLSLSLSHTFPFYLTNRAI